MILAWGFGLLSLLTSSADATSDDSREADMFGAPSDGPEATPDETLAQRVEENNNFLTVGGQFYLRYEWDAKEIGNWHNFPVVSPNLLDLYFDARPHERLRGYFRGRVAYDPTVDPAASAPPAPYPKPQQTQLLLDQFWLKFDAFRVAYFTIGRQPVRWGSGRFWNPTDFLNVVHRDPLAVFDQRVGITLLKIHVPWESRNWNYYLVVDLDQGAELEQLNVAARTEMLVGQTEFALTAAKRPDGSLQLGADISSGIGLFDLKFEGSLQHGLTKKFYTGSDLFSATPVDRSEAWLLQITGGAEVSIKYSDSDSVVLGVEYFYNQLGYDSAELFPVVFFNNGYTPLYFGRHYVAAYAQAAKPGNFDNTTFILSVLGNLSDSSALTRADWIVRVLTYMDFNAYVTYHFGQYGELRYKASEMVALMLPTGVSIPTPVSEVGLGLRLYF